MKVSVHAREIEMLSGKNKQFMKTTKNPNSFWTCGRASGSEVKPLGGSATHLSLIPGWDDLGVAPRNFSRICFL